MALRLLSSSSSLRAPVLIPTKPGRKSVATPSGLRSRRAWGLRRRSGSLGAGVPALCGLRGRRFGRKPPSGSTLWIRATVLFACSGGLAAAVARRLLPPLSGACRGRGRGAGRLARD